MRNLKQEKIVNKVRCMITAGLLVSASGVWAQGSDELAALQKQLNELSAKIAQLEQANAAKLSQIEADHSAKIAKLEEESKKSAIPGWVSDTKFKGDFRYRYENINKASATYKDRQRVRLRVGAYGKVNDFVDYGIRLATGGASATSANQSIGGDGSDNGVTKKEIRLDRYYVDLHPDLFYGAHLIMGKMEQPWEGRTGLVWDGDLNPEGIVATYATTSTNGFNVMANAGSFVVKENGHPDLQLWAGQLVTVTDLGGVQLTAGVSDFFYQRAKTQGVGAGLTTLNGNKTGTGFHLVEGFGSIGFNPGIPLTFNGQYVLNLDAASSKDTAYLFGFSVGKAKAKGTWEAGYNYRDTGADAVPDGFNDSDFAYGTTASKGHSFWAKYQIAKNLQGGLTYLMAENNKGQDVNTFQADLNFKF